MHEILLGERDRMAFEMDGQDPDIYEFVTPYGDGCYFEGTNRFRKGVHTVHYRYQTKRWLLTIVIDCDSPQSRVIDQVFSYLKETSDQDLSHFFVKELGESPVVDDAISQIIRGVLTPLMEHRRLHDLLELNSDVFITFQTFITP